MHNVQFTMYRRYSGYTQDAYTFFSPEHADACPHPRSYDPAVGRGAPEIHKHLPQTVRLRESVAGVVVVVAVVVVVVVGVRVSVGVGVREWGCT